MQADQTLSFGPYRLDLIGARLWRGKQEVRLTGKAFAVLRHLVTHAGELVTKDALLQAVWPETVVSDAALTSCIKELRQVLRDQAQERRYIETVHRRGFRFIGQISNLQQDRTKVPLETGHQRRVDGVKDVTRKLAAILSADVQGYSRLMSADEVATVRTLTAYRDVITTLVHRHRGRVVDAPGDNILAEFASVVDAVEGAVAMQPALTERNAELPPERRMEFRVGINLGDVVVEGERIYGDGVNIAARLEGLAEAGGLCIAGTVYDQVKNKLALAYEYLGERRVKNIAEPVRVYRVRWEPEGRTGPPPTTTQPMVSRQQAVGRSQSLTTDHWQLPTRLLGRDAELTQLHGWLERALSGERQIVFVTGEPGIGKTTLVDAFLTRLADEYELWIGRGQCIEHYGAGEAYLPLLEALGRLGRESEGQRLIELLSQQAPTWLVQMPALLTAPELEMLQWKTQGVTRERMLRELAEAVEQLAAEKPLVLWLEDLHWCDVSTLDWLAYVARRREPARLLVIGTYRPVDVLVQGHPLRAVKHELQTRGYCAELLLDFLTEEVVAEYLAQRFAVGAIHESPLRLARLIHRRTDGNPLFMINMVNDLVVRGVLVHSEGRWELQKRLEEVAGGVPESLQQLIEQQIERLRPETQRLLEVASVAAAEFSAASVAAGLETEVDVIEEQCEELVRREHFLRASGTAEWQDGTVAARYGFLHAMYQEVLYHRLTARRRQRLHQRIGEREEKGYGEQAREIAAELALHFERGREYRKAVQYLQHAGENAVRRSAHVEAVNLLTKGLELLKTLPDTPERTQQELGLQAALAAPLMATKGPTAEVERVYTRVLELCQQVGETPQLFWALMGLQTAYFVRAELKTAREVAEQCLSFTQNLRNPFFLGMSHHILGCTLFHLGEFTLAREYQEAGIALYDPQQSRPSGALNDLKVICLCYTAWALRSLGYPDQAKQRSHAALTLAQDLSHPHSLAYALDFAARLYHFLREVQVVQERAEAVIALSTGQGFPYWLASGTILRGWALAEQGQGEEGILQIRQGLAARRALGTEVSRTYFLALLAEAYGKAGQAEEGLTVLAEALAAVDRTGERYYEAELYRLKGQLTLQSQTSPGQVSKKSKKSEDPSTSAQAEAEACFHRAIEIARKQQAKSLELRAVMSLARLWQSQGKKAEARQILVEIYGWFTEGFDTKDLQEAKALLTALEDGRLERRVRNPQNVKSPS